MIRFIFSALTAAVLIYAGLAATLHFQRLAETTTFRLAYVESHSGIQSIFTMDFNGEQRRQLTDDFGDDFAPAWSPRNDYIAFYSFRGLSATVYLIAPDGGGLIEVALSFGSGIEPQWSSDGSFLVFERFTSRGSRDIMLLEMASLQLNRLDTATGRSYAPDWSPTGTDLLYISVDDVTPNIYLADARFDDAPSQQVTTSGYTFRTASWLEDGTGFVASATHNNNEDLYLLNMRGQVLARLTNHPAVDTTPIVSPDGRYVAFISDRLQAGRKQLYLLGLAERHAPPRLLSAPDTLSDVTGKVSWSAGGEWLAFTGIDAESGRGGVYRVHRNGTALQRLTAPDIEAGAPTFSPGTDLPNHFNLWWLAGMVGVGLSAVLLVRIR